MDKLYFDGFIKNKGFESTEDYLRHCEKERIPPVFRGAEYFASFLKNDIMELGVTCVRVRSDGNAPDRFYVTTEDGKLDGIDCNVHCGIPGIHNPEELLSLENTPYGWELSSWYLNGN